MRRFCAVAVMLVVATPVFAQPVKAPVPDYGPVQEQRTDLGHGLYVLSGTGVPFAIGNTTVAVGAGGIVLVDSQFAPLHDRLKAAVAALSPLPITLVINTHHHADHSNGNPPFLAEGVPVMGHVNEAAHFTGAAADGKPNRTYSGDSTTLNSGGVALTLVHPAPSHTDGDTFVVFKQADVIATGDLVTTHSYPYIDLPSGGSVDAMIATAARLIALCDDQTKIVPGHGPVTDKAGLIAFRQMLVTARDRIAKAKASGMSEQQVKDADLLADLDKRWKPADTTPASAMFPLLVYRSIK